MTDPSTNGNPPTVTIASKEGNATKRQKVELSDEEKAKLKLNWPREVLDLGANGAILNLDPFFNFFFCATCAGTRLNTQEPYKLRGWWILHVRLAGHRNTIANKAVICKKLKQVQIGSFFSMKLKGNKDIDKALGGAPTNTARQISATDQGAK